MLTTKRLVRPVSLIETRTTELMPYARWVMSFSQAKSTPHTSGQSCLVRNTGIGRMKPASPLDGDKVGARVEQERVTILTYYHVIGDPITTPVYCRCGATAFPWADAIPGEKPKTVTAKTTLCRITCNECGEVHFVLFLDPRDERNMQMGLKSDYTPWRRKEE